MALRMDFLSLLSTSSATIITHRPHHKRNFMSITIEIETSDGVKLPHLTTVQALDVFSQLAELLEQSFSAPLLFEPVAAGWLTPPYRITTDLPLRIRTPSSERPGPIQPCYR
jgi:hypothetical protein